MQLYNASTKDLRLLETWMESSGAPALFLSIPGHGSVGENALVEEIAEAVYRRNVACGIHREDSRSRHFASRSFPYSCSPSDMSRFRDELDERSEVTDEFFGVDHIDLTAWAGRSAARDEWEALVQHVQSHPGATFVFSARCPNQQAVKLANHVRLTCRIPVEIVRLLPPTKELLVAETLGERTTGPVGDRLSAWFESMSSSEFELSYTVSHTLTAKALILGVDLHKPDELNRFLDECGRDITKLCRSKTLGF